MSELCPGDIKIFRSREQESDGAENMQSVSSANNSKRAPANTQSPKEIIKCQEKRAENRNPGSTDIESIIQQRGAWKGDKGQAERRRQWTSETNRVESCTKREW